MTGSEFCRDVLLFPGYTPMNLGRNSACFKINSGQEQRKLSEYSLGSRENSSIKKGL